MLTYLIKSLRIFYNSYVLGKKKPYKFLNMHIIKKRKKNYLCFPFFYSRIKKNKFYKEKKKEYIKYSNFLRNKL